MPKLKAYTDDSAKSGHYILANVGGSHPITVQVTDLGEQILEKAGYSAGDNVPTKVVWSMFDVGILYTSGMINKPPEVVNDPDETFQQLGVANKLTESEQNQFLSYLNEYTGPNQTEIEALSEKLKQSGTGSQGEADIPDHVQEDLDRLSDLYERGDLTIEEYDLLKSRILDSLPSTVPSHGTPNNTLDINSSEEQLPFDLEREFWNLVPENKYDDTIGILQLENKATDNLTIFISYRADEHGFTYNCYFSDQDQEDRMFKLLDTDHWDLIIDGSDDIHTPSVMITRTGTHYGFQDELPDEYLDNEIVYLLAMIEAVFQAKPSNLALK